MSAQLTFQTAHHLLKLHDELLAAGLTPSLVRGDDETVWLRFDGDVDEQAVQAVIDAHDPTPPEQPESVTLAELAAEVRGMRERVAAVEVDSADAAKVRDAVAGR